VLDQLALADLITRGDLDRHLRRYRRIYASRREALLTAVAEHLPEATVTGAAAGLHAVLHVPEPARIAHAAQQRGVALDAIGGTLVVGYANLPESQAAAAIQELALIIKQSVGQSW
jgi:GntR family transcriptional regulator/MocR family aminotransferase